MGKFRYSLALVARGAAILTVGLGAAGTAQALPAYATTEGKSCAYCHVKPAGGGVRNYRGLFYTANQRSFAGFDDAAEAKKAGVEIGPDATPAPKSYTPPKAEEPKPAPPKAQPAKPPMTVAQATAKVKIAEAAHKKAPKDAAKRKAYAQTLADLGHATMLDQKIPSVKRYPAALKTLRQAVLLDPANKQAQADKKMIEDAYKSMGRPIPQ